MVLWMPRLKLCIVILIRCIHRQGNKWLREYSRMFNELIAELTFSETVDEFTATLRKLANCLDFDHFAYGQKSGWPLTSPDVYLVNSYPENWRSKYEESNFFAIDPSVKHGLSSIEPVLWGKELFSDNMSFWEEARSFGLEYGWAQATHSNNGNIGMLTFARTGCDISCKELLDKHSMLSLVAHSAYFGFNRIITNEQLSNKPNLTAREIELLKWTAQGKTASEIGQILNISHHTVNFHTDNCVKKLNVANKTAAAVKAAVLGFFNT